MLNQKRRDLVCARLAQMPILSYLTPVSGMFIMVNISAFFKDDKEFAQKLLDVEKLSVLPGSVFGAGTTGHIRLSLVQPEDVLSEGCNRLEGFLNALT